MGVVQHYLWFVIFYIRYRGNYKVGDNISINLFKLPTR